MLTSSKTTCSSTRRKCRQNQRTQPSRKSEPQESTCRLLFPAPFRWIVGPVGDSIIVDVRLSFCQPDPTMFQGASARQTNLSRAAMYTQVCSQRDATNEEEKGVERVEHKHSQGNGEAVHDSGTNQVEERQHGEDGNEDDIIYD